MLHGFREGPSWCHLSPETRTREAGVNSQHQDSVVSCFGVFWGTHIFELVTPGFNLRVSSFYILEHKGHWILFCLFCRPWVCLSQMNRSKRWSQTWTTLTSRWQLKKRSACGMTWWLTCTRLATAVRKLQASFTLVLPPVTLETIQYEPMLFVLGIRPL